MILSGKEIISYLGDSIIIDPFSESNINPNSYNLTLSPNIKVYSNDALDMKLDNKTEEITISEEGYVLEPGQLYLAQTIEYTETHSFVPIIIGRSSVGRLGISIHASAGFGDVGFCGYWTLSLSTVKPVRIYPNIKICQIYYLTIQGDYQQYSSKYNRNTGIQASKIFTELKEKM